MNNPITREERERSKCDNGFTHQDGVSLKCYFDTKLEAIKTATDLARDSMEKRLESMNEFRAQLNSQAGTFITRTEYNFLTSQIAEIKGEINKRPTWLMTFVFLLMTFLLGLVTSNFLE